MIGVSFGCVLSPLQPVDDRCDIDLDVHDAESVRNLTAATTEFLEREEDLVTSCCLALHEPASAAAERRARAAPARASLGQRQRLVVVESQRSPGAPSWRV